MPLAGRIRVVCFALFPCLVFATSSIAQNGGGSKSGADISVVPSVIRYSGQLLSSTGQPLTGTVSVTFGVYTDPDTKNALWLEVQSVEADAAGRYVVHLGAMTPGGLPASIFATGEARWIGAQALGVQEVRSTLLSVPYAMKAADAETLGGRPASDYLTIYDSKNGGSGSITAAAAGSTTVTKSLKGIGTAGYLSKFIDFETLGDSILFESAGKIGIGTTTPAFSLDVRGTAKFSNSSGSETLRSEISGIGGYAVIGLASPPTGQTGTGVFGWLLGQAGTAVLGEASANSGATVGVQGRVQSAGGVAGLFENAGGGDLLRGQAPGGNTRFRVDSTGAVYASSFRDLSGTAIPAGDITSVGAVTGLTGGGTAGDVTIGLDTAFTDGRYAANAHTHTVNQVAGAATLGANSFNGTQTITGNLIASGKVEGASSATFGYGVKGTASGGGFAPGVLGVSTDSSGVGVRGEAATGVLGVSASSTGVGVRGEATSSSGIGIGVRGESASDSGTGVAGSASTTSGQGIGVRGESSGATGMGVLAFASSTTGQPVGLQAVIANDGIAGTFEVINGPGDLIVGRTGPISGQYTNRFRVDGSGAVYATAYKDLNGNPIPSGTGDITGVAAGSGLLGGGSTGEVGLGLDTSFTNALYASKTHTHNVSEVSNAASLGANSFNGNQSVTGNVTASGNLSAGQVQGTTVVGNLAVFTTASVVNSDTSQVTHGVLGRSLSSSGTGLLGEATASAGNTFGIRGTAVSPAGSAVFGEAQATSGLARGVRGRTMSTDGMGVHGEANSSSGANFGVFGQSTSPSGTGMRGVANASSGVTFGVTAQVNSPDGIAGVFNASGGDILVGQTGGMQKFRVDGTGAVYAGSYRDLSGNPIGTATGDITAVAVGEGLSGGGTSGDVTLGLNTAFTDARYALVSHAHTVNQVSGAATLAANSFSGNQSITGNVTASGRLTSGTARFSNSSTTETLRSEISAIGGYAIIGLASPPSGQTGTGVFGWLTGQSGTAVHGEASASAGNTVGVQGRVESPSGIAGVFESTAGGDLLRGQIAPGTTRFRVDSTGAVYASSFRDLSGAPISSGDVTAVAVGQGLSGGGASGDVTVNLDTAFTDARYALTAHGHTVSQVSGAATLATNTFSGPQTINNILNVGGNPAVQSTVQANNSHESGNALQGTALGSSGKGVYGAGQTGVQGVSSITAGRGIFGWSTAPSGSGMGVSGESGSDGGIGVNGYAYSTTGFTRGVFGRNNSTTGVGVDGVADSPSGSAIGVRGTARGTGAGVQGVAPAAGVSGIFDNLGAGDILVGRVTPFLNPVFRVDGTGRGFFNNGTQVGGADFAESVAVTGTVADYEPGDVMIIDVSERRTMRKAATAYSTMVAGIYSTKPGVLANPYGLDDPRLAAEIPLAVIGIVPCKVTTENGAIQAGDLLVTSSLAGHAMKGTDRAQMLGAIVGKALEPLRAGTGVILVLVTLQ